jgi:hypothetical protein
VDENIGDDPRGDGGNDERILIARRADHERVEAEDDSQGSGREGPPHRPSATNTMPASSAA